MKRCLGVTSLMCLILLLAAPGAFAEEVYKKYRISFTINNQSTTDELRSNSENQSLFIPEGGIGLQQVPDPRPDSGIRHANSIQDDFRYDFQASYGVAKWRWAELTLDTTLGYFKGDLGDLEVAGEFSFLGGGVDPPRQTQVTRYHMFYIPMGKITEIPVQLGGTVRFRPRKTLNPFLGAGVGYMFVELKGSEEFNTFSNNVKNSIGHGTRAIGGGASISLQPHRLKAAEVDTPDTFEYHLLGGIEWNIAKGLSAVVSGSWMWAHEEIDIRIDGKHSLGTATPNGETPIEYPVKGLPVIINNGQGGLIDFGQGTPVQDPNDPNRFIVQPPDGVPDAGSYYAQGGTLKYNGFEFGFGIRYQF